MFCDSTSLFPVIPEVISGGDGAYFPFSELDHAFVASGVYPAFRSRSGLLDFYSLCDGNGGGFDHCLENTRDHPGESGGGTEG